MAALPGLSVRHHVFSVFCLDVSHRCGVCLEWPARHTLVAATPLLKSSNFMHDDMPNRLLEATHHTHLGRRFHPPRFPDACTSLKL